MDFHCLPAAFMQFQMKYINYLYREEAANYLIWHWIVAAFCVEFYYFV